MDDLIEQWYNTKKKTYHRTWELKQGGWCWCLFFTGDPITGNYHTGVEDSKTLCEKEIKWSIGSEIKRRNLL